MTPGTVEMAVPCGEAAGIDLPAVCEGALNENRRLFLPWDAVQKLARVVVGSCAGGALAPCVGRGAAGTPSPSSVVRGAARRRGAEGSGPAA